MLISAIERFRAHFIANAHTGMIHKHPLIFAVMTGVFLTCLLVANLIGSLLFSFPMPRMLTGLGLPPDVLLSAGIIPFPVTFILTDLLNEFYGPAAARFVTMLGFMMSILVYVLLTLGQTLPVDVHSPFTLTAFNSFASLYTQLFVASLTAYLIGQFLDIEVFQWFRTVLAGRFIWVRAQGSTLVSQLFDSVIVTFLAFWGTLPTAKLTQLALNNYLWKFLVVILITPLLYMGHGLLRGWIARQHNQRA